MRSALVAILRLSNGGDVRVKPSVAEALRVLAGTRAPDDFVEMAGEDGPVHVRPTGVIAVLDSSDRKASGFRVVRD